MDPHTLKRPGTRRRAVRSLAVEVVRGPDQGARITSEGDAPLAVGTSADNDLVLADRTVSRYHLELRVAPGGIHVEDLGSSNGTWLQAGLPVDGHGGARIEGATVPAGTELGIGDSILRVAEGTPMEKEEEAPPPIAGMVAESDAMEQVTRQVARLAQANVSVLIQGETGTGKEVVATALHELGPRAKGPLEVVDCGSMPATLVASELFGHERGAFTGADRAREGAFERADGGTLFLDEIGELPMAVQPALLGALERRRFRRVGGTREIAVDVRVVAATHRDLRAEVNADRFRSDLYYRLAVARLVIPPLRDRPEDVEPLVRRFVTEMTGEAELPFGPETLEALRKHRWSGNVRELRNVVEAAVAMGEVRLEKTRPGVGGIGGSSDEGPLQPYKEARKQVLQDFEKHYLSRLIEECEDNASEAARRARMDRQYLLGLLRRHGLR